MAGPVTAVTILAEIGDDLSRFTSPEKLISYAGLVPSHRNSADIVRTGGITKRGSRRPWNTAVEAAFVAVQHDPATSGVTSGCPPEGEPQEALVGAAWDLPENVWCMLTRKEPYNNPHDAMARCKVAYARRLANRDI